MPKSRKRKVIVCTVAFGVLLTLLQFFEPPIHKFFYASFCFFIGAGALWHELRNYEATKRYATRSCLGVFLLALVVSVYLFLVQPNKVHMGIPNLQPTLAVDSVSETNLVYHYEVTNVGNGTAVLTLYSDDGDSVSWIDFGRGRTKTINPGGTIQLRPPIEHVSTPSFLLRRTLKLKYRKKSASAPETAESFHFDVFRDALKVGSFHYESSGDDTLNEPSEIDRIRTAMRTPFASVWFAMSRTNSAGRPLPPFFAVGNGSNRVLIIDSRVKGVRFLSKSPSGHESDLRQPLPDNSNLDITLSWSDSGAMLGLNGKIVSDPIDFVKP